VFGFGKGGYRQLREALPPAQGATFDTVLSAIDVFVPMYWPKNTRQRTLNLVMARWIVAVSDNERLSVTPYVYSLAARMAETTQRFNAGDSVHGMSSTSRAEEIMAVLYEDGLIPPD
jgi:hypothetical protein